ncbi:MAG TPA: hypothetical protein IAA11_04365 [Candidatus Blautia intestinigallinarum]|nr:hypothetical protein [Candidatus Blautia intestinigallinarum]
MIALPVEDSGTKEEKGNSLSFSGTEESLEFTQKEALERQMEEMLSQVEGVGQVRVMLSLAEGESVNLYGEESTPKVEGVLIVAEGAGNSVAERNIQQAVMALFPVEAHKIKIMKMI